MSSALLSTRKLLKRQFEKTTTQVSSARSGAASTGGAAAHARQSITAVWRNLESLFQQMLPYAAQTYLLDYVLTNPAYCLSSSSSAGEGDKGHKLYEWFNRNSSLARQYWSSFSDELASLLAETLSQPNEGDSIDSESGLLRAILLNEYPTYRRSILTFFLRVTAAFQDALSGIPHLFIDPAIVLVPLKQLETGYLSRVANHWSGIVSISPPLIPFSESLRDLPGAASSSSSPSSPSPKATSASQGERIWNYRAHSELISTLLSSIQTQLSGANFANSVLSVLYYDADVAKAINDIDQRFHLCLLERAVSVSKRYFESVASYLLTNPSQSHNISSVPTTAQIHNALIFNSLAFFENQAAVILPELAAPASSQVKDSRGGADEGKPRADGYRANFDVATDQDGDEQRQSFESLQLWRQATSLLSQTQSAVINPLFAQLRAKIGAALSLLHQTDFSVEYVLSCDRFRCRKGHFSFP